MKPSKIHLHKGSNCLELQFADDSYQLSAEFLRVHSPSAEVKGHGPGQETLIHGKLGLGIENIKAMGNYGLQILFEDGHDSGIYSWNYLKELCKNEDPLWQTYLKKLNKAGKNRDPHTSVIQFNPLTT